MSRTLRSLSATLLPGLASIARILTNRRGRPWVMRCGSQAEIDALPAEAGSRKQTTSAPESGIFTVSVAESSPRLSEPSAVEDDRDGLDCALVAGTDGDVHRSAPPGRATKPNPR